MVSKLRNGKISHKRYDYDHYTVSELVLATEEEFKEYSNIKNVGKKIQKLEAKLLSLRELQKEVE